VERPLETVVETAEFLPDAAEVVGGGDSVTTVGVLITPRSDGVRPWDTTMIATTGDLELEDHQLAALREAWKDAES